MPTVIYSSEEVVFWGSPGFHLRSSADVLIEADDDSMPCEARDLPSGWELRYYPESAWLSLWSGDLSVALSGDAQRPGPGMGHHAVMDGEVYPSLWVFPLPPLGGEVYRVKASSEGITLEFTRDGNGVYCRRA